jgi:hypothetical protein
MFFATRDRAVYEGTGYLVCKRVRATVSVGISPTVFSNMQRRSRKIGDRISALKYALRPFLRCCNLNTRPAYPPSRFRCVPRGSSARLEAERIATPFS